MTPKAKDDGVLSTNTNLSRRDNNQPIDLTKLPPGTRVELDGGLNGMPDGHVGININGVVDFTVEMIEKALCGFTIPKQK